MFAPSRRRERRADIVEMLKTEYQVQDVIDYSGLEQDGVSLEGTGAITSHASAATSATSRWHSTPRTIRRVRSTTRT